jgi:hypothetical protein
MEAEEDKNGNLHGLKVLGFGILSTGILIGILSIISPTGGWMGWVMSCNNWDLKHPCNTHTSMINWSNYQSS